MLGVHVLSRKVCLDPVKKLALAYFKWLSQAMKCQKLMNVHRGQFLLKFQICTLIILAEEKDVIHNTGYSGSLLNSVFLYKNSNPFCFLSFKRGFDVVFLTKMPMA